MEWELRHARSFVALADRKHFGKAAKLLGISQPALSTQIKQLETELGPLIIRQGGFRLTETGTEFLEHARRIVADADGAANAIAATRGKAHGQIKIGHSPSHRELAVTAIARLLEEFPDVRIGLEELLSPYIETRIRDGRLDLGLVSAWTPTNGVGHEELTAAPLRLIIHPDHATLAAVREVTHIGTLAAERFVMIRRGLRSRRLADAYFETKHFRPRIAVETNAMASVLALVGSVPQLIAVVPVPVPHVAKLRGLPLLRLPEPVPVQSTSLIWRLPEVPSEAARRLTDVLHDILDEAPPDSRPDRSIRR